MRKWILTISTLSLFLLPFSLKALPCSSSKKPCEWREKYPFPFEFDQYSASLIGSDAVANHLYTFFSRFTALLSDFNESGRQLITLYPNERISLQLERKLDDLSPLMTEDHREMKAALFITLGIYKISEYHDPNTIDQFRDLQSQIAMSALKELFLAAAYLSDRINEEGFYAHIAEVETSINQKIRCFCENATDPFFSETVISILDVIPTRVDIIHYFKDVTEQSFNDDDEDEDDEEDEEDFDKEDDDDFETNTDLETKIAFENLLDDLEAEIACGALLDDFDFSSYDLILETFCFPAICNLFFEALEEFNLQSSCLERLATASN